MSFLAALATPSYLCCLARMYAARAPRQSGWQDLRHTGNLSFEGRRKHVLPHFFSILLRSALPRGASSLHFFGGGGIFLSSAAAKERRRHREKIASLLSSRRRNKRESVLAMMKVHNWYTFDLTTHS
jgi:hypothetical protein